MAKSVWTVTRRITVRVDPPIDARAEWLKTARQARVVGGVLYGHQRGPKAAFIDGSAGPSLRPRR